MKHPPDLQPTLEAYVRLLQAWNARLNLVSRAHVKVIWERHIHDSLQLAAFVPSGVDRGIDLGSGAGFPGLVLALATGIPFTLIEADRRKSAFLLEAARLTNAPVKVLTKRAEACHGMAAPLVTARAFARLPKLLAIAAPFVAPQGCLLLPKGAQADAELTQTSPAWNMRVERFSSRTAPDAVILRITDLAPRPN